MRDEWLREFAVRVSPRRGRPHRERAAVLQFSLSALAGEPPVPLYLDDVAACELAIAESARGIAASRAEPVGDNSPRAGGVRRCPGVVLLRCRYDIRPLFEDVSRNGPGSSAIRCSRSLFARCSGIRASSRYLLSSSRRSRCWAIGRTVRNLDGVAGGRARLTSLRDHGLVEVRALRICIIGKYPADTGRGQHADLLARARSCRARPRSSRRDQCQGGRRAVPHVDARRRLGAVRASTMPVR